MAAPDVPTGGGAVLVPAFSMQQSACARGCQHAAGCSSPSCSQAHQNCIFRAVQPAIRDGKLSGTWEMGADGPGAASSPSEGADIAGQITMRMSWRPVAAS